MANLPIVAPPAAFREAANATLVSSASLPGWYYPQVTSRCNYGDPGCSTPGYVMQWPYLQIGSKTDSQVLYAHVCMCRDIFSIFYKLRIMHMCKYAHALVHGLFESMLCIAPSLDDKQALLQELSSQCIRKS
jgi:hypothetical protein